MKKEQTLGILSIVFAIVATLFNIYELLCWIILVFGAIGLILGIVSTVKINKKRKIEKTKENHRVLSLSITGVILNSIIILIYVSFLIYFLVRFINYI